MNKYELKAWAKSKNKKYWVFTGIIAVFILIALICGVVAMYMSGYTIISWFAKFGWICLIVLALGVVIGLGIYFISLREK